MSPRTRSLILVGALIALFPHVAIGQGPLGLPSDNARGIRHILFLNVKLGSDSQFLRQSSTETQTASVTVKIRVSAHSQETNFFGVVSATVPEFNPIIGSHDQEVWKDAKCHHERGYPKITILSVDGSATSGQNKSNIAARIRQLGLLLPGDEISASKRIASDSDDVGRYIVTRTETKQSHLFIDLKLYILPCDLSDHAK